ncbi:hypothetical protein EVAR_77204_1 [Eumeta japonica]|uniref:Uncharacterized protein n=1 Tax=Eumeta variegata TaxID=151549 RepID=A0A4C1T4Z9_EUMVA|nr:hypothetical protein EVAR_77204_1 [Eumeta japonica]
MPEVVEHESKNQTACVLSTAVSDNVELTAAQAPPCAAPRATAASTQQNSPTPITVPSESRPIHKCRLDRVINYKGNGTAAARPERGRRRADSLKHTNLEPPVSDANAIVSFSMHISCGPYERKCFVKIIDVWLEAGVEVMSPQGCAAGGGAAVPARLPRRTSVQSSFPRP